MGLLRALLSAAGPLHYWSAAIFFLSGIALVWVYRSERKNRIATADESKDVAGIAGESAEGRSIESVKKATDEAPREAPEEARSHASQGAPHIGTGAFKTYIPPAADESSS